MKRAALFTVAAVLVSTAAVAQAPRVVNAKVQERAVTGSFDSFVHGLIRQQSGAAWLAYSVPAVPGHRAGCCGNGESYAVAGPCYLEGRSPATGGSDDRPVKLEGDATLLVLFRVENQQIGRIALFSPDCPLDAGGLPFLVLTGVKPGDSVQALAAFARDADAPQRVGRTALAALALHADAAADVALQDLVGARQPNAVRKQAAFWLGVARGERGYEILRDASRDQSADFRKEIPFALSQSPVPAAIDTLLSMAKGDADPAVRGQALFSLAQKAGKKAAGALTDAIANDPESQVKERAVFALAQLPKDEGVPLLINVARSNRDPKVRQRAMFWLGQSKDPRAVAFFEEILKSR